MKRFTLIIVFCSIAILLFSQTRSISVKDAQIIADRNATEMWGNVSPATPIIYYSADDQIVAYRFNYAINKAIFDPNSVLQECAEGRHNGDRFAQWGSGNYGNILMSARTDLPVTLEHGQGLSSEFAYGEYLQEQAEAHLGSNYSLERIYYINGVNVWHHFTNGSKDIYIQPFSPAKVGDYEVFKDAINESEFFCETGDFNSQWDEYLTGNKKMSKSVEYIPYYTEMPFYDWSYGCSPTAAAMLVGYWDIVSMHYSANYSRFVDYHFERDDPLNGGGCGIDPHVPNVQLELATAMNTDLATGNTWRTDIAPGYNTVATNNGYSFSCSYHHDQTTTWYFNEVMTQINANRPLHISISGHSITGMGYDDVYEEVATHYTHQSYVVWITKSQLQATYPIVPGGAYGLGIEVEKPDGDQTYCGTSSGENLYAGDVYEITWDYEASAGSYVHLYYSTNHGVTWSTINSNTPNDGVYDWVIPSGLSSTGCRIATTVFSSGGSLWGSDGSYGDFQIYSGGSLYTLGSDAKVNTATAPDYYQFNNPYSTWCAVGVRNNTAGDNWSMRMYSDNTFATELVSSGYTYPVDFVVMDRHHYSALSRGIKAYRFSGTGTASVEFEGDQETFTVGTSGNWGWTAGDVVEMFDVYLTPGIYGFKLDIVTGTADLDFGLFGSTDGIYYKNRNSYLAQSITSGSAVDEYFTFTVTTSDYYGLCIWANDANSATYNVTIERPGTWTGLGGTSNWHVPANWSALTIPDATIDVTIPAGTPYSPGIWLQDAYCKSITIESGAALSVYDDSGAGETLRLYVSNDMIVHGDVYMWGGAESYDGEIQIGNDITWADGSVIHTTANNQVLRVYGSWFMQTGADVHMDNGTIMFLGSTNEYIENDESTCYLHNVSSYKTGGAYVGFSYLSAAPSYVNGDIYIHTGAAFNGYNPNNVYLQGDINNHGTFIYNYGTLVMTGSSQYLRLNAGCYLNDFTVNSTGTVYFENGYSNTLTVNSKVQIDGGVLNCGTNVIEVGGDWDNNVGTAGFDAGTGTVHFNGNGDIQYVYGETSFYNVQQDYVAPGSNLQFMGPTTVLNDMVLNHFTWVNNTFDLNGTLNINNTSSKFTANAGGLATIDTLDQGGTVVANGGEINILDVVEAGIFGTISVLNGTLNYFQDPGQFPDINADINITDGTLNVSGGSSGNVWGFSAPASINMSDGEFNLSGNNVSINDGFFTENITGGIITFDMGFNASTASFTPTGGTVRMVGGTDGSLGMTTGANFFNVEINKSGGDKSVFEYKDRNGNVIESTKDNIAYLGTDLEIEGELIVDTGKLSLNANTLNCYGDVNINDGGILNVNDNSTLALDNGSYLNANSGGIFQIIGSAGNEARLTRISTGYYNPWIRNGGMIRAEHAIFEYMSSSGVYLLVGSLVDPIYPFNNCTFQNGSSVGNLITKYNTQTLQVNNANFPTNTWGGDYNVKNTNLGDITFYNASGGFAGPEFEFDDYNTIHWTTDTYQVDLEAFLQGPFNPTTTKMDYTLNDLGLIPTTQPFNSNPSADWYYTGSESVGSIPDFAIDWVLVELRDASNVGSALPGRAIATQAGFVLNNGVVVGLDGLNPMEFNAAVFNNLYVTVWHRNHLGVISASPLVNVGGTYSYSFMTAAGQAYGGTSAQVELTTGIWGILSGDANGNGSIGLPDKVSIWNTQAGETGYKAGDFNLDGQVNNPDKDDYWVPNYGADSYIPE